MDYYLRFVERFPRVNLLAEASEDEVLKYWQGLGYYSRARNLHKAAKKIMHDFEGKFPLSHADIIKLPGIGVYTAAAICSFAYNLPFAVVDGNVYRVISRIFSIETPIDSPAGVKLFNQLAHELLNLQKPGLHNQAIMEFGALHCLPANPLCDECILNNKCLSFAEGNQKKLPVKSLKIKVKERFFNYLFIEYQNYTFFQQRTANDIWKMLWEFPVIEDNSLLDEEKLLQHEKFRQLFSDIPEIKIHLLSQPVRHILTHRIINARFIKIEISELNDELKKFEMIKISETDRFAVSRLMEIFFENHLA
jgi:A/G-specific adenine glycosylase